jgi:accessory gene regulator B
VEALAHNLAEKIAIHMNFDKDKKAVIAYGLTAILQMMTIFTIITVIGLLFDFWYESLIIFFGVGIIRKSTGGAHSKSMSGCIIISIVSVTLLSILSKSLCYYPLNKYLNLIISLCVYFVCFLVFYLRVPVDNPNKPLVKPEKIKRLRRQSFIVLAVFFMLSVAAIPLTAWNGRFLSIGASLNLTMLWQMFTLTKTGYVVFGKIDSKINTFIG